MSTSVYLYHRIVTMVEPAPSLRHSVFARARPAFRADVNVDLRAPKRKSSSAGAGRYARTNHIHFQRLASGMLFKRFSVLLLLGVGLGIVPIRSHGAGVFRWVDANGHVQYGERPPDKSAQSLNVPSAPAAAPTVTDAQRLEKQRRLLQVLTANRQERELTAKKAKDAASERERKCHVAKDELDQLRHAGALYDLDADGNRRNLNDAEHTQALKTAEDNVAQSCG